MVDLCAFNGKLHNYFCFLRRLQKPYDAWLRFDIVLFPFLAFDREWWSANFFFVVCVCVCSFFCWNEHHFNGIESKVHKFKWTAKSQTKNEKITKLNFTFIDLRHSFNSKERHKIVTKKNAQKRRFNLVPELIYWTRSYFGIESKFISCAIRAHRHYFCVFFFLHFNFFITLYETCTMKNHNQIEPKW